MLYGLILIVLVFFMPGGIVAGVRLLKAKVVRVVPRLPDVRVPSPIAVSSADDTAGSLRSSWTLARGSPVRPPGSSATDTCACGSAGTSIVQRKGEQVDDTISGPRGPPCPSPLSWPCWRPRAAAIRSRPRPRRPPRPRPRPPQPPRRRTEAPSVVGRAEQRAGRRGILPGADHQLPGRRHARRWPTERRSRSASSVPRPARWPPSAQIAPGHEGPLRQGQRGRAGSTATRSRWSRRTTPTTRPSRKPAVQEAIQGDKIFASAIQIGTPNVAGHARRLRSGLRAPGLGRHGLLRVGRSRQPPLDRRAASCPTRPRPSPGPSSSRTSTRTGPRSRSSSTTTTSGSPTRSSSRRRRPTTASTSCPTVTHEATSDLSNEVTQILASNPDVILAETTSTFCTNLMKLARQGGFTGPIMLSATCQSVQNFVAPAGEAAAECPPIVTPEGPLRPGLRRRPGDEAVLRRRPAVRRRRRSQARQHRHRLRHRHGHRRQPDAGGGDGGRPDEGQHDERRLEHGPVAPARRRPASTRWTGRRMPTPSRTATSRSSTRLPAGTRTPGSR